MTTSQEPHGADDNDRVQAGETLVDPEADAVTMNDKNSTPGSAGDSTAGWEQPIPFDQPAVPDFPVSCLPSPLSEFAAALAESTQVPAGMPGSLVLAVVAATIQRKVVVEVKPDYAEPLSLYVAVVADPGTRKTAVMTDVTRPLLKWEREQRERLQDTIERARITREAKEKRKAKLLEMAAREKDDTERARCERQAMEIAVDIAKEGAVPAFPRLIVDDATPEALAHIMEQQGERITVFSAEGGIFEIIGGRYSKGTPNLDVYLKGHGGDFLRIDRRVGPPLQMMQPTLTMGLAIQPDVLRSLSVKPGFRGRGLIARILFAYPASIMGRRQPVAPPLPEPIAQEYERCLLRLLELELTEGKPVRLNLSSSAEEERVAFATRLEPRLGQGGDLVNARDWAGKAVGAAVRIAGVLHAVLCAHAGHPVGGEIHGETMQAAVHLVERFFLPHALAALVEMGVDPAIDKARRVVTRLRNHHVIDFTVRELYQVLRGQGCFAKVADLRDTLDLLEEHDYVLQPPAPPHSGPGRPGSARYLVNPHIYVTHPQNTRNCQNQPRGSTGEGFEDSEREGGDGS